MKVVLLAPTPPPAGGIAGWTDRMMNAQLKNGWTVSVVDEKVTGKRQVFGEKSKRNYFSEIKRCFKIWSNLKKELKDSDAKVVHSCIPSMTLSMMREYVCACITKRRKRKFIIHFRCTVPNTTKGRLGRFMLKRLCNKSDLIMSLNSQTSDYLGKITKTPITLIPNFVSSEEIAETKAIRNDIKKILYVGGVIESKGAYDVIEVARHFPSIEFRLVGKAAEEIESYVEKEKITNVILTGPKERDAVKAELADADVFIFLTYFRGEGFSNALAEAMAAGLPCIATDWAANKDMIGTDGGVIVAVKDVDAAIAAIEYMKPQEIRMAQSERNIAKVKSKYVDTVVLEQYVEVYETCV